MANPWTKKNPAMSMFLSAANASGGAARGLWMKEARRHTTAATNAAAKQVASFWTAALTPSPRGKSKHR